MIEVFKTNVKETNRAKRLINLIHRSFAGYTANFDLDDCDNILRVKCETGTIHSSLLIHFLKNFGCEAQILPDDDQMMPDKVPHLKESTV
jgi:hypothetical protein